jgi:DNA-binding response OmpR family regulator
MGAVRRILIIENDALFGQALVLLLEDMGKQTMLCSSGQAGLEAALADPPDVVICDLRLGDMQGDEVLLRLKENTASGIPTVLMTGSRTLAADKEKQGADYFLPKPFQARDLVALIEQIEIPERD